MLVFLISAIDDQQCQAKIKYLYEKYGRTVKNIISKRVKEPSRVEDLVHETFVCMIKNLATVEKLAEEQQKAYLFTVAKNVSINSLRTKEHLSLEEGTHSVSDNEIEKFLKRQFTRDDFEIAVKVIRALPERYKDVLSLHYITGMKDTEIAALRKENINTVRSKIRRGRQILIEELKKEGVER